MKLKTFFSFILLICVNLSMNAQLKVLQNGRVQVGSVVTGDDPYNATSMQIYGNTGTMRTGSKLSFGDFGRYDHLGWNVFAGEYGTTDTDQLWLHGKLGIYLTSTGNATNVVAYYNPSVNSNFVFNTNLRVNGINISSDARLKENIKPLQNPLNMLSLVNGVSYTYSLSAIKEARKQDESKFVSDATVATSQAGIDNTVNTAASDFASSAETAGKMSRDKQLQAEIDSKEAAEANRKRIGFLAQDIQIKYCPNWFRRMKTA
ncbi:MAG: tail fiber domain-containing protein [Tannerellaceae bacterium]|nr:tail fiber domain-containing protein [Tannerellaceae bacterium]